ncbi:hypothetical protein AAV35_012620 [Salimicrobium jeotgali]|uniref:Uncharacterized protein n=1 Tax=Salimicrobium jeotgali TaxID=1230341 RepID=K2G7V7_9BACI|nr:hypothetical protein [Salimicrobium jeotgali]AKG05514.1 hypothetical protein AAV35_012620 [Salimicrobium jeotgali]EKE30502.1 hypothetical protein MJ3_13714 [Salimicrobium jeotgali]MBM7696651.1 hypothetical protein [Salimicrobium jeotgali]
MIVTHVNRGKKADYALRGTTVMIGKEISVDLNKRQGDTEQVINISLDNKLETMQEGVGAWYVATIVIPAIRTELYDSGEVDEEGYPICKEREAPLNMSDVELRLWTLPANYFEKHNKTTEEGAEA